MEPDLVVVTVARYGAISKLSLAARTESSVHSSEYPPEERKKNETYRVAVDSDIRQVEAFASSIPLDLRAGSCCRRRMSRSGGRPVGHIDALAAVPENIKFFFPITSQNGSIRLLTEIEMNSVVGSRRSGLMSL
jgi:hypothetical protein